MARAVLRGVGLAAVAASSLGLVMALEDPLCAIHGQGYNDPGRNSTPNGGYPNTSKICQEKCANQTYCEKFTYYTNSKGCWLQGETATDSIVSPYAISGPVKCPEVPAITAGWSSPENLSAEALALWNKVAAGNVTYESNELEATAKELDLASLGVPETVSTQVVAGTNYKFAFPDKSNVTVFKSLTNNLTLTSIVKNKEVTREFTVDDKQSSESSEGGGFPWWIILIALLALILCGGLAYYFMGGTSGNKDKKKKKKTVEAKANDEEAPLVVTPSQAAPAPAAASMQAAAPVQYQQTSGRGMQVMSGASVASPVAYSVAPPAAVAPVQYVAPAQYVYSTTSASQMMPVAQPFQATAQPGDLFTQFDTDGDGRLSREELEAGMASMQRRPQ